MAQRRDESRNVKLQIVGQIPYQIPLICLFIAERSDNSTSLIGKLILASTSLGQPSFITVYPDLDLGSHEHVEIVDHVELLDP